ncbi:MAG: hypothetical protein ACT4QC_12525 [Planctomycetaceae bacterium]
MAAPLMPIRACRDLFPHERHNSEVEQRWPSAASRTAANVPCHSETVSCLAKRCVCAPLDAPYIDSTLWEFNNRKNSLKSGGSRIVAIHGLSEEFERCQAFERGFL